MIDAYNGEPKSDMEYPDYYHEMIDDEKLWMIDSLAGTWFKVDKYRKNTGFKCFDIKIN